LYGSFASLFLYTVNYYIGNSLRPYGGGNIETPSKLKKWTWISLKTFYIASIFIVLIFEDTRSKSELLPFLLFPGLYFITTEFLIDNDVIKHDSLRLALVFVFVLFPIISFYTGTKNSYEIYDNNKYDYSTMIVQNDTIKFLGKASDHYIFVSTDNKDKYFFSTDEIKGLKLTSYSKIN
jgi:hypothetical protein